MFCPKHSCQSLKARMATLASTLGAILTRGLGRVTGGAACSVMAPSGMVDSAICARSLSMAAGQQLQPQ